MTEDLQHLMIRNENLQVEVHRSGFSSQDNPTVVVTHVPSGITYTSNRSKSSMANKSECIELITRQLEQRRGAQLAVPTDGEPHLFHLQRLEDATGVSGTGRVADGVIFHDGTVAMRWRTETSSVAVYASIEDVVKIHGHNGATVVYISE